MHGGSAPQVRAAAQRRIAIEGATRQLARLGMLVDIDPLDALLEQVHEAAANVAAYRLAVMELGIQVGTGDEHVAEAGGSDVVGGVAVPSSYDEKGKRDPAAPHILVAMYNDERDRLARYAKLCLDAGVDERRVRLVEHQARAIGEVVEAALRALDPTPELLQAGLKAAAAKMRLLAAGDHEVIDA